MNPSDLFEAIHHPKKCGILSKKIKVTGANGTDLTNRVNDEFDIF